MNANRQVPPGAADDLISRWLTEFEAALGSRDYAAGAAMLAPDGHWRDVLAFTWDLRTFSGCGEIESALKALAEDAKPRGFRFDDAAAGPREVTLLGVPTIEGAFLFETALGRGRGLVRLIVPEEGQNPLAWTLLTTLYELKGFEESRAQHRLDGSTPVRTFGERNWLEELEEKRKADGDEPTVLIVGAGQAGLTLGARLNQLNVRNVIVDPNERVGDNWRKRYHSLVLHNETPANHLPYMPFPDVWPDYISKDKLAGWLEAYAESLELNVRTETTFVGADYDEQERRWTARLRGADSNERVVRPRHIVLATGANGIPNVPDIPGLADFDGDVVHSSRYTDGSAYRGKRAIIFGSGNSSHDAAQDLHGFGAEVTMVQRGSTTVVSADPSAKLNAELYMCGLPVEDADLIAASIPYQILIRTMQQATLRSMELDRELLEGLERAGFRTDWGEDNTGWVMKYRRTLGGYYLNVGCSDLIISGDVRILQATEIDKVVSNGVLLQDGSVHAADLIVLGTGYLTLQSMVERMFGAEIAELVGPIWGLDAEGEIRNVWRPTAQPGLWFMAGSLLQCRSLSRVLALQIKAIEEGIHPAST